jgi:hypothetical protein
MRERGIWVIPLIIGALTLVLLIACANVTALLLSRAAARQHEIAIRLALGSGRVRLLRMLLTEGLMLAGLAGVLSIAMAYRFPLLLMALTSPQDQSYSLEPDWRVFVYASAATLLAGCLSGLTPAMESLRADVSKSLKGIGGLFGGDAHAGSRVRSLLVGAQVSMSLVLLAGAGVFVRAHYKLMTADPGFDTKQTLFVPIYTPGQAEESAVPVSSNYCCRLPRSTERTIAASVGELGLAPVLRDTRYSHSPRASAYRNRLNSWSGIYSRSGFRYFGSHVLAR